AWQFYGYSTRAVLRFERRSPTTVTATICTWDSTNPTNADDPDHRIEYLTYHRTGTPPPVNQRGPRHAPTGNVFGQWYAIRDDWDVDQENTMCNSTPINRDRTPTPGWPLHGNDDL
ncbi:hypothetical protein QSJ18_19740, partial [Gordonia sp. ABSL1-1]|uniref:hypothetical protein n=1 Tax=Gordonia sp. ABSL1-1 TaxID=3053923 RepID=UPI0025733017